MLSLCCGVHERARQHGDRFPFPCTQHPLWAVVRRKGRERLWSRRLLTYFDSYDKAIALPMQGLNHALLTPVVINGQPCRPEAAGQRPIADKLVRPQMLVKLLPGNHAVVMLHQIDKHLKDLRFEVDNLASAA